MTSFADTAGTLGDARAEAYCGMCNRSYPLDVTACPTDGTKLVRFKAQEDPMLGRVLDGRYRIEARLGEGGMGAVYRACQLSVDRLVAIKVVHPSIAADREVAKRFLREARLASSLNCPGIVSVLEFGQTDDGILYLAMELLDGRTLGELVKQGPLDVSRAVQIALQLCDALEVAHAAGVVHRDLKPGNILVIETPTGEVVKVLDFGIAKASDTPSLTSTHGMVGTPLYMAPEQFDGRATSRSDLYSLGCVLHELLTGAPPFVASEISVLIAKHLTEDPPALPAYVPAQLAKVVETLLAKSPAERFPSVASLRASLQGMRDVSYRSGPILRTSMLATPAHSSVPSEQTATALADPFGGTELQLPPATPALAPQRETRPAESARSTRGRGGVIAVCAALAVGGGIAGYVMLARPMSAAPPVDPAPATRSAAPVDQPASSLEPPVVVEDSRAPEPAATSAATVDAGSAPIANVTPEAPRAATTRTTKTKNSTRRAKQSAAKASTTAAGKTDASKTSGDTQLPFVEIK